MKRYYGEMQEYIGTDGVFSIGMVKNFPAKWIGTAPLSGTDGDETYDVVSEGTTFSIKNDVYMVVQGVWSGIPL